MSYAKVVALNQKEEFISTKGLMIIQSKLLKKKQYRDPLLYLDINKH